MTDAYSKCRKCANFGTENCPESSLCFALNYKPFYKAKAKSKMKKKYRRAVCKCLIWLIKARWIFSPIVLIAWIITFGWLESETWNYKLEHKLRVYDTDPD